MMLSESKHVLWVCAPAAGFGAVLSVVLSAWLLLGGSPSPTLDFWAISLVFLGFLCSLAAVLLMTEYTRASTAGNTGAASKAAPRRSDISSATRHCPREVWIATVIGIILASVQFIRIGAVDATLGQELTATELRGFLAGATVLFCVSLPVIVSAARMDGGYGD